MDEQRSGLPATGLDVWQRVKRAVGVRPSLYFAFTGLTARGRRFGVSRDTELVIEGYPRSGNSFATNAFRLSQARKVRLAHHLHVPAQVIRAARWKIPAIVLIREPQDAVTSLLLRHAHRTPASALREYIWFYRGVAQYSDSFMLVTFDELTRDFGACITRLNARFQTRFAPFEHTDTRVREIFARLSRHGERRGENDLQVARPSVQRSKEVPRVTTQLTSPALRPLLDVAKGLYASMAGA